MRGSRQVRRPPKELRTLSHQHSSQVCIVTFCEDFLLQPGLRVSEALRCRWARGYHLPYWSARVVGFRVRGGPSNIETTTRGTGDHQPTRCTSLAGSNADPTLWYCTCTCLTLGSACFGISVRIQTASITFFKISDCVETNSRDRVVPQSPAKLGTPREEWTRPSSVPEARAPKS